jgi:hypothetical protein
MRTTHSGLMLIVALTAAACSGGSQVTADGSLLKLAAYPRTIDATTASGTLELRRDCVVFRHSNGQSLQPVFPPNMSLEDLEQRLSLSAGPIAVTFEGFQRIEDLPAKLPSQGSGCPRSLFVYGSLSPGIKPPPEPPMPRP